MEIIQQIITKISEVPSVLIIGNGMNGDSVAGSLALRSFLKKMEKDAVLLIPGSVSDRFRFLPQVDAIEHRIDLTKSFVIDLSTKKSSLAELSYKKEVGRLSIYLKPSSGEFTSSDVTFRTSNLPYDLVILVGISSLEQLGEFYSKYTELFFDVPMINLDFRASNENYGQYNLVNLSATSVSEIVLDLINKFEASLIDESIATQLLTGIIAETNSFQHIRTTPQTFLKASQLVNLGAKQQEIISHLYKTKTLGLLKLWGRVLARLKQDSQLSAAISAINQSDLEKSGASSEDTDMIIKEMVAQLGFAKIFLFLKEESENLSTVYAHSNLPINLINLFKQYNLEILGPGTIKFAVSANVLTAEKQLTESLKSEMERLKLVL
jgi:nanoRNase/pAp phosphatase (c-di-AMP/oligoRNAs hydrolase)